MTVFQAKDQVFDKDKNISNQRQTIFKRHMPLSPAWLFGCTWK